MQNQGPSSQECLDKLGYSGSQCLNDVYEDGIPGGSGLKRNAADAGLDNDNSLGLSSDEDTDLESKINAATKKEPPPNGKKTKGRVKIKMEFIDNKLRRYTTFSKRKTGIMKKAYELSTLTGTQVMLLVASETGHVYTFATRKLQPMITSEAGKALIQTCLNSPDNPLGGQSLDQRMCATGFEETELTYSIGEEEQKSAVLPLEVNSNGQLVVNPNPALLQTEGTKVLSDQTKLAMQQIPAHTRIAAILSQGAPVFSAVTTSQNKGTSPTTSLPPAVYRLQSVPIAPKVEPGLSTTSSVTVVPRSETVVTGSVFVPSTTTTPSLPVMYQTPQGLVYAGGSIPEGLVLNFGNQNSGGSVKLDEQGQQQQQFITIPMSVSLAGSQLVTAGISGTTTQQKTAARK